MLPNVQRGHPIVIVSAALAIVMVALLDLLTPPDVAFAQFYVVPVVLVAWAFGWRIGVLFASLAAGAELLVDSPVLRGGLSDESFVVLLWNALSSLVAFSVVAVITDRFHGERQRWQEVSGERARLLGLLEREFPRPLRAIDWFARTYEDAAQRRGLLPETVREQFVALRHHAREVSFLATDLIRLGRIGSGDLKLELETVDLSEIARQAVVETIDRNRVSVTGTEVLVLADPAAARHAASAIIGRLLERSPSEIVDLLVRASGDEGVIEFVGRGGGALAEQALELPQLLAQANGGRLEVIRSSRDARILLYLRRSLAPVAARPAEVVTPVP